MSVGVDLSLLGATDAGADRDKHPNLCAKRTYAYEAACGCDIREALP